MSKENKKIYKDFFIRYGIILGFVVFMTTILVFTCFFARKIEVKSIKKNVNNVFQIYAQEFPNKVYKLSNYIKLEKVNSTNCLVYSVTLNERDESDLYAVVTRTSSLYGPLAALFIYNSKTNNLEFINFLELRTYSKKLIENNFKYSQISYWEKKIPLIISSLKEDSINE